ncbi:MAG: transporter substrate-binding domain-containing protein [Clostridiales bacterium]|nr:transporter substrate-binding domain-containing protein [Clostridiales bacterium]
MMKRLACMVVSVLLAAAPFLAPAGSAEQGKLPVTSLDLLAQPGISIAVGLNTPAEASLKQDYPQATLIPYSDIFLAYLDVANGRVDACVNARREMEFAIEHGFDGVRLLEDNYATNRIAVGISPVSPISGLKDRLNAFIAELRADGTLDDMYERWVTRGEETMPEIPEAENPAFTLRVGTTGTVMPYSYYIGTELAGYDIELARRFAARIGAKLELKVYDFGGIIPAAEGGSIDCIMSNLFYTEEKEESIPFSDVLFTVEITAMVRDGGQPVSAAANGQLARLDGKRIGAATGTTFDAIVRKALPAAEIVYINTAADLIAALEAGKIDGFAVDEPAARQFCRENPRLAVPDEYMDTFEFGFVLPKTTEGEALLEELDAWLVSLKADGGLEQIIEKWTNGPEEEMTLPDYDAFPAPKGVLTLATEGDYVPMTYYRGNRIVGVEIDLAARFCEACGYGLEIKVMNFDGILPAVQSGKADLAAAGITITDERRESVNFSAPYYSG